MTAQESSETIKNPQIQIPLWRQLQSTANVLQAVRSGESGTSAIKQVDASLRPGVQALSFHVWRWLGTAEIIKSYLAKRAPPPQADALLCVALAILCGESSSLHYEAFTLVDQAVEAAKRSPNTNASSNFINACLRRYLREKDVLTQKALTHPVGQWNHPQWWIKRLKIDHPNAWQEILRSNNAHAPLSLRLNVRKMDIFQRNTFIHIDLLNKSTTIRAIKPITSITSNKGIVLDPGNGQQKFEVIQNQPIINPVNAIKTELESFYRSIIDDLPLAVSLFDAEIALQLVRDIELQINPMKR